MKGGRVCAAATGHTVVAASDAAAADDDDDDGDDGDVDATAVNFLCLFGTSLQPACNAQNKVKGFAVAHSRIRGPAP
jgi:hypothetical protein